MTPVELKSLIASDVTAAALFSAADDARCGARCASIAPPVRVPVPCDQIRRFASLSGSWAAITMASRDSSAATAQIKGICITFIDWVQTSPTLDFDLPQVKSMAGGLIAAGLITQAQVDEMTAMMNKPQIITAIDVEFVRTRI